MATPLQRTLRAIIKAFMDAELQKLDGLWLQVPEDLRTNFRFIERIAEATRRVEVARQRRARDVSERAHRLAPRGQITELGA